MTATLEDQVRDLRDRQEVTDLVTRLGRWLDADAPGAAAAVLTDDVRVRTPGGEAAGRDAVVAQARRTHEGVVTRHLFTGVLVAPHGDRATVAADATITFDRPGLAREHHDARYTFEAARTPVGWRLAVIEVHPA